MLKVPEHNKIIKDPFATQICKALQRKVNGEYTEEELKQIKRSKEILSEYEAIWV